MVISFRPAFSSFAFFCVAMSYLLNVIRSAGVASELHLPEPQLFWMYVRKGRTTVVVQFGVRHALACRIALQTEVCRTFALKLHHYPDNRCLDSVERRRTIRPLLQIVLANQISK